MPRNDEDDRHTRPTPKDPHPALRRPNDPYPGPRRPAAPGIPGTKLPDRVADNALVREAVASVRPVEPERRKLSPPGGTAPPPSERPPSSVSPQVDQAIGKAVRGLWAKLWPMLLTGALAALVAGYIQFKAMAARLDALTVEIAALRKDVLELQSQVAKLEVREQARTTYEPEFQAWLTAVLERTQGVRIERPKDAAELPAIKTETPIRQRGRVTAAPVTTVKTPPPAAP